VKKTKRKIRLLFPLNSKATIDSELEPDLLFSVLDDLNFSTRIILRIPDPHQYIWIEAPFAHDLRI